MYFGYIQIKLPQQLINNMYYVFDRKRMERSKEETLRKSEQARQLRELETASALKRLEVKKKLQEVRKVRHQTTHYVICLF